MAIFNDSIYKFYQRSVEAFADRQIYVFSICLGKKNAEVIKFLGIFENKINFCSNKKSNVSINKSVIENIGISGNIFKLLLRVFSMTGKEE